MVFTSRTDLSMTGVVEHYDGRAGMEADLIAEFPELLEFHRVPGNDSYIFKVIVASTAHLELVINRLVPYGPLTTSIVLSSPVPDEPIKQEAFRRSQVTLSKS